MGNKSKEAIVEILIMIGALVVLCGAGMIYAYCTVEHTKIKVSDKSIKVESVPHFGKNGYRGSSSHSVYMVFTQDGKAFKNANSLVFWKFDSDELQARLKTGGLYKVKTSGLRIPILGFYKNIIKIEQAAIPASKPPRKKPRK